MPELIRQLVRDPGAVFSLVIIVAFALLAVLAPVVAPYGPAELVGPPLVGPRPEHLLGTDEIGRDLFSRVLYGARTSLWFGVVATLISMLIGIPWGLLSGYLGGVIDVISMRITDALLAFPSMILAMAVVAVLGPEPTNVMIAVGVVQIPRFSRLVRAEVMSVAEREFVQAVRGFGGSAGFIVFRSILPNLTGLITVQFTLTFATAVLTEASLSYLGLGVQPPTPAWGSMLQTARNFMVQNPLYSVFVGGAIFLAVLSLSLLGDSLRDVTDPQTSTRRSVQRSTIAAEVAR